MDKITYFFRIATDFLLIRNPLNSSMGIMFGFILDALNTVFYQSLESLTSLKFTSIKLFHFIAIGLFGFNLKSLFSKNVLNSEIESSLSLIRKLEMDGKITHAHAGLMYQNLCEKIIINVTFNNDFKEREKQINEIVKKI